MDSLVLDPQCEETDIVLESDNIIEGARTPDANFGDIAGVSVAEVPEPAGYQVPPTKGNSLPIISYETLVL